MKTQPKIKSASWWIDRISNLESDSNSKQVIAWYRSWSSYSTDKKNQLKKAYQTYIESVKNSPNAILASSAKAALLNNNIAELKEIAATARLRLANGDYMLPPLPYNPEVLEINFYVLMLKEADSNSKKDANELESFVRNTFL